MNTPLDQKPALPPCPVCHSTASVEMIHIQGIPIFCNMLWDSREEALAAESGDMDLVFCRTCAHVYNAAFEDHRMQYSPQYDNTLDYSPTFQKYIRHLADRLVSSYQLQEKDIIEFGCGQGNFLHLLAESGRNRCLGYDPSYNARQADKDDMSDLVSIIPEYYSEQHAHPRADLVVCRQVLEHIKSPVPFLRMIRNAGKDGAVIFVEVPNAMYTLRELGIWDLIYEHYSYFTALSLGRLFGEAGLKPLNMSVAFGGQYLCIEGRAAKQDEMQHPAALDLTPAEAEQDALAFADNYRRTRDEWRRILSEIGQAGEKAAVWGAGSKGITFLNVLPGREVIDTVIDINPNKKGRYIPGTGQQVVPPERIPAILPDVIIVMNPLYLDEIKQTITDMNLPKDIRIMPVNQI